MRRAYCMALCCTPGMCPCASLLLSLRSMCGHCGWSKRLLGYWLRKWSINSAKQKAFHFLFLKTTLNSNLSFPMGVWLSKASGWGRPTCLSTDDSEQSGGGVDTGSGLGWSDFSSWYCICQPCDLERFMCYDLSGLKCRTGLTVLALWGCGLQWDDSRV